MTNGHPKPEVLALFESGDLAPKQARLIEAHITACVECQATLNDLAATRDLLRAALPEPGTGDLLALRSCVLANLPATSNRRLPRLGWVVLAATVALLIAVIPLAHRDPKGVPQPSAFSQLAAPSLPELRMPDLSLGPVRPSHTVSRPVPHRKAGMRDAAVLLAADGSAHLRIQTTDPNVVILLPINENTHEETN